MRLDLVQFEAADKSKHWAVHVPDAASRFQLAHIMKNKTSRKVIQFLNKTWIPIFGAPSTVVADFGPEFVSAEFEAWCQSHSIYLCHAAVEAPWQNGIAERTGGLLKTIFHTVVKATSAVAKHDLQSALAESLDAYNRDVDETGFSPSQWVIGRQPRSQGDVLGGTFSSRLAEHGLMEHEEGFARRIAMREVARVAMTKLHFSRGIRRAELARPRVLNTTIVTGDLVYFWRAEVQRG